MTEQTPRFALPLLEAGQSQKEVVHNEAIMALETLAQPIVETIGDAAPPAGPAEGASWIVGNAPTGTWAEQGGAMATWTGGGWRFLAPIKGMAVFARSARTLVRYQGGTWVTGETTVARLLVGAQQVVGPRQPAIAAPAGGVTIDSEARVVVSTILAALRQHGLIAT